ncbi:ribosomal RNA small subunit methyltransferase A [Candidatus Bipolaricaulota bacterium]|nr:ribosomal RNA small subunit methyltransferase A [Candidatus Bipolaricaulota bacterium]
MNVPDLTSPHALREILSRHGIRLRKGLSQHFLVNRGILERIVTAIAPRGDEVAVEVGAGIGTLTLALAPRIRRLYAVEIDRRLVSLLRELSAGFPNVEVVEADFLELPLARFGEDLLLVGNIPYRITSPLLLKLIREWERLNRGVFTVQLEVAEKLTAPPGHGVSRLGMHLRAFFQVEFLFVVPREAFLPPPRVDSAVVRLWRLPHPRIASPPEAFEALLRAVFSARRKTLLNALRRAYPEERVRRALAELGLDPRVRGETLPLEVLDRLSLLLGGKDV